MNQCQFTEKPIRGPGKECTHMPKKGSKYCRRHKYRVEGKKRCEHFDSKTYIKCYRCVDGKDAECGLHKAYYARIHAKENCGEYKCSNTGKKSTGYCRFHVGKQCECRDYHSEEEWTIPHVGRCPTVIRREGDACATNGDICVGCCDTCM